MRNEIIPTRINGRIVNHHLKTATDDEFLLYLEAREGKEEDEALVLFYDTFARNLTGIKGELPANWHELLPASEKRDVARRTFLHFQVIEPEAEEVKDDDGLSFSDYVAIDRNQRSYTYQTYENGQKKTFSVTLRLFTAKERKDLVRVLSSETNKERYKTEYAAKVTREAILQTSAGVIPVIHLSALALHHLTHDSLVLEKN